MELIFLGTGAGMPTNRRNVTSMALRFNESNSSFWLFDCGEATQHQIMKTTLKLSKLEKIFITHLHGDHLFGLPGLLTSRAHQGVQAPLQLFGPIGVRSFIDAALSASGAHLDYELQVIEIDRQYIAGDGNPLFEDEHYRVYCAKLEHRIECFGYRIEEKDKAGKLDDRKLAEAGIPSGPLYGRLKRGEIVVLEDGRTIDGNQFIGPPTRGRTVAIMGDTRVCSNSVMLAEKADLLVHEATFSQNLADLARDYYHSTSTDAANTAQRSGASALIITHLSARYQDDTAATVLDEAREIFPNSFLATDLWSYPIIRNVPIE